jgi:DNA-binding transcriptional regulator PaaX
MAERTFKEVQRDLDETLWNLKGTNEPDFRRALIQKMRRLLDQAQRIADA